MTVACRMQGRNVLVLCMPDADIDYVATYICHVMVQQNFEHAVLSFFIRV